MGLRIRTNVSSLNAQRKLAETTLRLSANIEKLSGGHRINRASDDAAGLGVSENLRAKIRSMTQAKRNANDGVSLIQVAEAGMNEVSNILIRLRELSIQAASDTIGNRERSFANKEYMQLVEEIDRIGNVTEFNGIKLLRGGNDEGSIEKLTLHVGAGDGFKPNHDTIDIDLSKLKILSNETFGIEGEEGIGPVDPNDQEFSRDSVTPKLKTLDDALNLVNSMRSELGAKQSRLNSTINNLAIATENMSASKSRIRDVDFASETASYTQNRILQQGGASILSQANSLPELVIGLIR
ncbi:MAG: flagellin FliC [Oligoflexales bacterium]|nr:flagellin FliC [Oligoflexales bacterium]